MSPKAKVIEGPGYGESGAQGLPSKENLRPHSHGLKKGIYNHFVFTNLNATALFSIKTFTQRCEYIHCIQIGNAESKNLRIHVCSPKKRRGQFFRILFTDHCARTFFPDQHNLTSVTAM